MADLNCRPYALSSPRRRHPVTPCCLSFGAPAERRQIPAQRLSEANGHEQCEESFMRSMLTWSNGHQGWR